jgi:hypothetical protein
MSQRIAAAPAKVLRSFYPPRLNLEFEPDRSDFPDLP